RRCPPTGRPRPGAAVAAAPSDRCRRRPRRSRWCHASAWRPDSTRKKGAPSGAPFPRSISDRSGAGRLDAVGVRLLALVVDVIDDPPGLGLFRAHEVVAVQGLLDLLVGAAGVVDVDLVQPALGVADVLGVALDVR